MLRRAVFAALWSCWCLRPRWCSPTWRLPTTGSAPIRRSSPPSASAGHRSTTPRAVLRLAGAERPARFRGVAPVPAAGRRAHPRTRAATPRSLASPRSRSRPRSACRSACSRAAGAEACSWPRRAARRSCSCRCRRSSPRSFSCSLRRGRDGCRPAGFRTFRHGAGAVEAASITLRHLCLPSLALALPIAASLERLQSQVDARGARPSRAFLPRSRAAFRRAG